MIAWSVSVGACLMNTLHLMPHRVYGERLGPVTRLQLGLQMVRGLQALRAAGFAHCDIKLQNLLVRHSSARGHA